MRSAFLTLTARRALLPAGAAALLLSTACKNPFETDTNNPNAVVEEALGDPAGATTLVNGLGASVTRALASVYGPYAAASDELTWSGSREAWGALDFGDVDDPVNEYTDAAYPFLSEARWMTNFVIPRVETLDSEGTLRARSDLARAYIYGAVIYITIGDMFDDFVIGSDRTNSTEPIGQANMSVVYDSAASWLTKAIAVAQDINNAELQRQALGLRARAHFSKAVWNKLKPARTTPTNPYVADASATADATAALGIMDGSYRFSLTTTPNNLPGLNIGFEMNSRGEIRVGTAYGNADPEQPIKLIDGLAGIALNDPLTGEPDPVLARRIDECCRVPVGNNFPFPQTSGREMLLILAEAAIAGNNTAEARNRINQLRALDDLPAWDGVSPSARDMLIHERRVNLFLQGRRLADHYRFGDPDARWLANNAAARRACFFPITFVERQANPLVGLNSTEKACR